MIASAESPTPTVSRVNPLVRLFTSVWFGIVLLFLILVYACVFSALPQVRGAIEVTEMEAFAHWSFVAMIALFALTLTVTTWRRIRWNVTNLGVLTVHTGLLLLAGGSAWYFGTKVEGDVLLLAPRVEVIAETGGQLRVIDRFSTTRDTAWQNFMPALGGSVRAQVLDSAGNDELPVSHARVAYQLGSAEAKVVQLDANAAPTPLNEKLSLRLRTPEPETTFYDRDLAALHFRPADANTRAWYPLRGLPLHRERYLNEGYTLRDANAYPVPSKRASPHIRLAGLTIPTGWFEPWRLPIRVDAPALPFDVEVTGYLPYVEGETPIALEGAGESDDAEIRNPAAKVELRAGRQARELLLFPRSPSESFVPLAAPSAYGLEARWVDSEAQRDELLRPLAGPHELTIEVVDPPVQMTVAISDGQVIQVEGTSYELKISGLLPNWPMMSPGFENAVSPVARVDVRSAEKSYNRTVIERFPQLTQDIDEAGTRHRDGPYDPNLKLTYRSSPDGKLLLVMGPRVCRICPPVLGVFDEHGQVQTIEVGPGTVAPLQVGGFAAEFRTLGVFANAERLSVPVVVPLDRRRPNLGRNPSAIRLRFNGRGDHAGWSTSRWVTFSAYPDIDAAPLRIKPPFGEQEWEFIYSRAPHALGANLQLRRLSVNYFPGRQNVESWRSDFLVKSKEQPLPTAAAVYTNQTATVGRWTLFQSGAPNDHWSWTILGVGNRNGIWAMLIACVMIPLGCLYAFYVKPVLIRRRKQAALERARAEGRLPAAGPSRLGARELVESR